MKSRAANYLSFPNRGRAMWMFSLMRCCFPSRWIIVLCRSWGKSMESSLMTNPASTMIPKIEKLARRRSFRRRSRALQKHLKLTRRWESRRSFAGTRSTTPSASGITPTCRNPRDRCCLRSPESSRDSARWSSPQKTSRMFSSLRRWTKSTLIK